MSTKYTMSNPLELALRRRILRPRYVNIAEVGHFYKSHAVIHGVRVVTKEVDGKKKRFEYPIEVARFMVNPQDPGCVHIVYFTGKRATAQDIARLIPKDRRPWMNDQRSTFSFGKKESWHNEPAFSTSWHTRVKEWNGTPSANQVGPFWIKAKPKAYEPSIWLQGRKVAIGDVGDAQIDTNLNEDELSYVEKIAMLADKKAWAAATRAGELPGFTE
tara:strand:- start:4296 stop:4943 length:648 start_codon:yes stop_codon:yes gene_type:complete